MRQVQQMKQAPRRDRWAAVMIGRPAGSVPSTPPLAALVAVVVVDVRAAPGGNSVFQLVNARYERAAMIPTCNRGFAQ